MLRAPTLLFSLLLVAPPCVAQAQAAADRTEQSRRAYALSGELMSPFCPGRTLSDCPSPNAAAWREDVRAWVESGVSDEEIVARLQARTSVDLSSVPASPLGWSLLVALLMAGTALGVFALRRMVAPAPAMAPLDPALEAELRRELEPEREV